MSGTPDAKASPTAATARPHAPKTASNTAPKATPEKAGAATKGRRPPAPGAPLAVAAAVTAGWAAVVSATPVLLAVAAVLLISPNPTDTEAVVRGGFAAWLLAHGVPLWTDRGPVSLVPLGITALAAWRVARAGVHAARAVGARRSRSALPALRAGLAVGLAYGAYGAAAALAVSAAGLRVPLPRAALTLAVFGLVLGLAGALYEGGWPARWAPRLPGWLRDGVRTGGVAALLVLAAGAAATGLALALSAGGATDMVRAYRTGVVGQAGLTLICLAYAPNVAVWGASYLVGPGFSIGAGTTVSAAAVALGPVPALPVLAAVPARPMPVWSGLLLGVPLVAGMAAGWLLARRQIRAGDDTGWPRLLVPAALAGPVAGAALALAALASAGSLGGGRLVTVGAAGWPLAGMSAAVVGAGALVAAASTRILAEVRRSGP
jgi:hypothetical protein